MNYLSMRKNKFLSLVLVLCLALSALASFPAFLSAEQTGSTETGPQDGPAAKKLLEDKQKQFTEAEAKEKAAKETLEKAQAELDKSTKAAKEAETTVQKADQTAKDAATKLEAAEQELENSKKAVKEAEAKLNKLINDSPEFKAAKEKLENAQKDLDAANTALTRAKEEADQAAGVLQQKQADLEKVKNDNANYVKKLEALEKDLADKSKAVEEKTADVAARKEDEKSAQEAVSEAAAAVQVEEAKTQGLTEAVATAQTKVDDTNKAKTEAEARLAEAQKTFDEAEKKICPPDAQKAKEEAKKQWDKGSVGFFEANGSSEALAVFTTEKTADDGTSYLEPTRTAGKDDARDLDRMKASIEALVKVNAKRQSDKGIDNRKLSVLNISDFDMAVAQANANWSNNKIKHSRVYKPPYENLYWGSEGVEGALVSWWDAEKHWFDTLRAEGKKSRTEMDAALRNRPEAQAAYINSVGHYTNLVDDLMWGESQGKDSQTAGYAIRPASMYGEVHSLVLNPTASGKVYTIEEYKARFDEYYNDLKAKLDAGACDSTSPADQVAYDKAKADLEAAQKEAKTATEAAQTAADNLTASQAALSNNAQAIAAAEKTLEEKEAAKAKAAEAVKTAQDALDAANQAQATAQTGLDQYKEDNKNLSKKLEEAEQAVTDAQENLKTKQEAVKTEQAAVDEKTEARNEAQKALDAFGAEAKKAAADVSAAKDRQTKAQADRDKAESAKTAADQAKAEAAGKKTTADQAKQAAQTAKDNAQTGYEPVKEAYDQAKKELDQAQAYYDKFKPILELKNITLNQGQVLKIKDLIVKAQAKDGTDLSDKVEALNLASIDLTKAGSHRLELKVTDKDGLFTTAVAIITVKGSSLGKGLIIIRGNHQTYYKNSSSGLTVVSNGEYEHFVGLRRGTKLVSRDNYSVKKGSTILTLKKSYLDSLPAGIHNFYMEFSDGSTTASVPFVIEIARAGYTGRGYGSHSSSDKAKDINGSLKTLPKTEVVY